MTAPTFCCIQPAQRIDSPEPPARPIAALDGIFAAAALPEDHPHALKIPNRKPTTDADIVQSPDITSKIKLQFRRSSLKELKSGKDCDEDAHPMTLKEVLDEAEKQTEMPGSEIQGNRDRSTAGSPERRMLPATALKRNSINYSLPLTLSDETHAVTGSTRHLAKSTSSPMLLSAVPSATIQAKRSSLPPFFGESLSITKRRSQIGTHEALLGLEPDLSSDVVGASAPGAPRSAEFTTTDEHPIQDPRSAPITVTAREYNQSTDQRTALHQMDISQQLRSMSQMSDISPEEISRTTTAEPWSSHRRERSGVSTMSRSCYHSRQVSIAGMDSTAFSTAQARIQTPVRDTASSIYSRPGSADVNAAEYNTLNDQIRSEEDRVKAIFADWPLKSSPICQGTPITHQTQLRQPPDGQEKSDYTLPAVPGPMNAVSNDSQSNSAPADPDRASVQFLSPPTRASSIPSKSSSSTLTKTSVASRFLERLSPPKKAVRKRRSIFQFLRPGSRKQNPRSISSPMLRTVTTDATATFDGPSDDPGLLTVQYELPDNQIQVTRSLSMSHVGVPPASSTSSYLAPSHHQLQRQPTLAEYEKSLTLVGDDRRRPSTINLQRAKEIHDDDRRDSSGLRKRISRARPLQDAASPLMAQALAKHQQEKAFFTSSSKQRDHGRESQQIPAFTPSDFSRIGGSLPPPSLRDHNDLFDPLERGHLKQPSEHGSKHRHLLQPSSQQKLPSIATTSSLSIQVPSTAPSTIDLQRHIASKKRIGTNLESWSRYPSHSRTERCGSASLTDAVLTRDFAVDVNHEDMHEDANGGGVIDSPRSKRTGKSSSRQSRFSLPLSRSTSFGGMVRYYSNLFHTRGWYGQNRRTSVATGGRLEYPELEMLPPQLAESPRHHHHGSLHPFHHMKEELEKDAGIVKGFAKDEEAKIGQFAKQEEKKLGDFVRNEEVDLADLVDREEKKLGEFVKKEERKFVNMLKDDEEWWKGRHHLNHHQQHHSRASGSEHSDTSSQRKGPSRAGSIFSEPSHQPERAHPHRSETMISPDETVVHSMSHDGTDDRASPSVETTTPKDKESVKRTQSKAEIWSDVYKNLLITRPQSPTPSSSAPTQLSVLNTTIASTLKPVPTPRPTTKSSRRLDPGTTIRRFPSVTVIDDRKGHVRSVSLISVGSGGGSTRRCRSVLELSGLERESTLDLLERIEGAERREREKLVGGAGVASAAGNVDEMGGA